MVKIGCCGFGISQAEYVQRFSVIEVQQTFYQQPKIETLRKWRSAAPANFEFALKAWQLVTHTAKSPTYKRLKRSLTATESAQSGDFKSIKNSLPEHQVGYVFFNNIAMIDDASRFRALTT